MISQLWSVSYSPDGSRLASASGDGTVKVCDATSGANRLTLRGHTGAVMSVSYSPDGSRLASAAGKEMDGEVKVWDARTGAELLSMRAHTGAVFSVRYSPDSSRIVSAGSGLDLQKQGRPEFWGEVKAWDAKTGAEVLNLREHSPVLGVAYSPDGSRLAAAAAAAHSQTGAVDKPGEVKVRDARTGAELLTLRGHSSHVWSVSYSPDGSRIASGGGDHTTGEVKVWDATSGAELLTLRGHTGWVSSVSYSPDGTRIASASQDGTIRIWDARTGQLLAGEKPSAPGAGADAAWPSSGTYDPWAEDFQRRTVLASLWHAEELQAAQQRGDAFAAAFHRRYLALGDNLRILAWRRLAAGDLNACRDTLRQLHDQQIHMADLARPWQVPAVVAMGLTAQPTLAALVGPAASAAVLDQEQQRRAALLVRAAALVADNGLEPAELVKLAQSCVQADPQSWRYRELLGAALYRAGKPTEAVRELDEAVRLHGTGSLWARLFLALAHQRLGHAEQAQALRQQVQHSDDWEEMVLQAHLLHELDTAQPVPP
jgi:WD40 repeat protein